MLLSGISNITLESDGISDWRIVSAPVCPSTPATLGAGAQTLQRQGPYTRVAAPTVIGANSIYTFAFGFVSGDLMEISVPTHDAFTITVHDSLGATLATFPATTAGGGRFIYRNPSWDVLSAGGSTT